MSVGSVVTTGAKRAGGAWIAVVALTALGACKDTAPGTGVRTQSTLCDIDTELMVASVAPDAIPALTNPPMVGPDAPEADYLRGTDRVLGVVVDGEARAYPHNILWWHEIINDQVGDRSFAVTFCPLTGSGVGFDRTVDGTTLELGVSGLLFANNLVMFDRGSGDVYGPQLTIDGVCDSFRGTTMELLPVQEMSWDRWKELHPDTRVVSGELSFDRPYQTYPYPGYDELENGSLLTPMEDVDQTRPLKERVLAVRDGLSGRGYPFLELDATGDVVAINETIADIPTAVFYESRNGKTALAFDRRVDGQTLTFDADVDAGVWIDRETGSTWRIDGLAVDGPLAGERLRTREDAFTVFWFAWRHFQPRGATYRLGDG